MRTLADRIANTKMVREAGVAPSSAVEDGVEVTFRLVAAPELDGVTGRYFNGAREAAPHEQARDPSARRRLRKLSEQLTAPGTRAAGGERAGGAD